MLQQFSWGEFLIASIVLIFVWYVLVALVAYRVEVSAFFCSYISLNGVKSITEEIGRGTDSHSANFKSGHIEREVDLALMGASKLPEGVEIKSSASLNFAAASDSRYDQLGLIADVVQELKQIFIELEKMAGNKRDFFLLLDKVKEEYGPLGGHPSIGGLTCFIVERAPFHLTADEIDNLWH